MNVKPTFAQRRSLSIAVSAAAGAFIGVGLLSAVAVHFQRDGTPFARRIAAERACARHAYASEREDCMRGWLNASRAESVASR